MIRKFSWVLAGCARPRSARRRTRRLPRSAARQETRDRAARHSAVFSVTIAYVAEEQGFFKKHGANVEIRPFDNGTAAARAVVSGDLDMAWSPTPPVINQVSNAGVPLVAIYGMPNPTGCSASTEPARPARISPARTSASIRSRARARWRCAR